MFEVVDISADEWTDWRDLRLAALADAPEAFNSTFAGWENANERQWRERLERMQSRNLIARVDGRQVGMLTGVPHDDHVELISMWVAPECRGSGLGELLVRTILSWAVQLEKSVVRLRVKRPNDPARSLYERCGFRFIDACGDEETLECRLEQPTPAT